MDNNKFVWRTMARVIDAAKTVNAARMRMQDAERIRYTMYDLARSDEFLKAAIAEAKMDEGIMAMRNYADEVGFAALALDELQAFIYHVQGFARLSKNAAEVAALTERVEAFCILLQE